MDRLWRRVLMGALFWGDDLPEARRSWHSGGVPL